MKPGSKLVVINLWDSFFGSYVKQGLLLIINALVQYGPIIEIDLKIPPRPPGYAFVEVRSILVGEVVNRGGTGFLGFHCLTFVIFYSLKMNEMLKMLCMVAMGMTLMGIVCG